MAQDESTSRVLQARLVVEVGRRVSPGLRVAFEVADAAQASRDLVAGGHGSTAPMTVVDPGNTQHRHELPPCEWTHRRDCCIERSRVFVTARSSVTDPQLSPQPPWTSRRRAATG